uniref:Uncharacterized protein n=1 Tax=Lutzomyia longipalpis TaxID=7200 RepID=A0A1B0CIK8_LUTLO
MGPQSNDNSLPLSTNFAEDPSMAAKNNPVSDTIKEDPVTWMFWKKRRYIVVLMAFLGFFNVYSLRVFASGIGVTAILTLVTPVAAKHSLGMLLAVRIIEGVFEGVTFPCIHAVWARWAPVYERSRMATLGFAGNYAGTVVAMPLSGVLAVSLGWESVFYFFGVNPLDIAPNHASVILGISNTFATIPGIVSPLLTGVITSDKTKEQWQVVFYISSGIYLVGCVIYWFFCRGELQPWAKTNTINDVVESPRTYPEKQGIVNEQFDMTSEQKKN